MKYTIFILILLGGMSLYSAAAEDQLASQNLEKQIQNILQSIETDPTIITSTVKKTRTARMGVNPSTQKKIQISVKPISRMSNYLEFVESNRARQLAEISETNL